MPTGMLALFLILSLTTAAGPQEAPQDKDSATWRTWNDENKLIVVTTPDWDDMQGTLTRFERRDRRWIKVSEPTPVVVGRAGMAWDPTLTRQSPDRYLRSSQAGPIKHEGDGRSPAGIFQLKGETFGFSPNGTAGLMEERPGAPGYTRLTATIECVDDPDSHYYGHIVDHGKVDQVDWKSSEKMSSIPQYRWGVVVNYNTDHPVRGDGSCIFLHQWSGPAGGTAGCTAMSPRDIEDLVHWVNGEAHAALVQLPRPEYQRLRRHWQLPALDTTPAKPR